MTEQTMSDEKEDRSLYTLPSRTVYRTSEKKVEVPLYIFTSGPEDTAINRARKRIHLIAMRLAANILLIGYFEEKSVLL